MPRDELKAGTKRKAKPPSAKELAKTMTDYLFTDGAGVRAYRLLLVDGNGNAGGGWAYDVVCDYLRYKLEKTLRRAKR